MMVAQRSCENSAKWSDGLKPGNGYLDVDMPEEAKPQPKAAANLPPAPAPADQTYETITRQVFSSYAMLAGDKKEWLEGQTDQTVMKQADKFKQVDIKWNDNLAALALAFENEAAPCDHELNADGDSLLMFVLDNLDDYEQLHMVSYEGPYTTDPKEIIAT